MALSRVSVPSFSSLSFRLSSLAFLAFLFLFPTLYSNNGKQKVFRSIFSSAGQDIRAPSGGTATSGYLFRMKRIRSLGFKQYTFTTEMARRSWASKEAWKDDFPKSSRWAVITSIFAPTELIHQLAGLEGWCVVVVGDLKGPREYKGFEDKCVVYLTPAMQKLLPYRTMRYVKWNHFSRKNIGFVFAMHHGAEVIYDTDDDNMLKRPTLLQEWSTSKGFPSNSMTISSSGSGVVNPYPLFLDQSLSHAYPRGFPLDFIKNKSSSIERSYTTGSCPIAIVQSLADVDPDVDAISRLAVPHVPFNFSSEPLKALVLDKAAISPWNAQATLFFREAFPLLLLPSTVHGRVSDIWRSYFASHIMKGGSEMCIAFSTPWVYQQRNAHSYLADFQSEIPLYLRSTELTKYLLKPLHKTLESLYVDMYEHGILDEVDVRLAHAWIHDVHEAQIYGSGSLLA
jgi:STELLO glycosyltransferases